MWWHADVATSATSATANVAAHAVTVAEDCQDLCETTATAAQEKSPTPIPASGSVVHPPPGKSTAVAQKQKGTPAQHNQPGIAHSAGMESNNPAAVSMYVAAVAASSKQAANAAQEALLAIMRGQSPPSGATEKHADEGQAHEVCAFNTCCRRRLQSNFWQRRSATQLTCAFLSVNRLCSAKTVVK